MQLIFNPRNTEVERDKILQVINQDLRDMDLPILKPDDSRLTDDWLQTVADRWFDIEGMGEWGTCIWEDEDTLTEDFREELKLKFT